MAWDIVIGCWPYVLIGASAVIILFVIFTLVFNDDWKIIKVSWIVQRRNMMLIIFWIALITFIYCAITLIAPLYRYKFHFREVQIYIPLSFTIVFIVSAVVSVLSTIIYKLLPQKITSITVNKHHSKKE